tara:strand:- start:54 stop:263 length:210 start_codon:yes stop_codon:yes gene_type:complete
MKTKVTLKAGYGYFDFTKYPIGGKFCRVSENSKGLDLFDCVEQALYKGVNAIGKTEDGRDIAFNKEYLV